MPVRVSPLVGLRVSDTTPSAGQRVRFRGTVRPPHDGTRVAIQRKRADGTWLIRSKGTSDGKPMHFGMVCTADGQKCVRWDADGAKFARKSVRILVAETLMPLILELEAVVWTLTVTPDGSRVYGADAATDRAIAALESRYRDSTGVGSLKIRHNNMIGYHIEVTLAVA